MPGWYTRMQPDRESSHNIPEIVWTHSWVEMLCRQTHYLQHMLDVGITQQKIQEILGM